MLDVVQKNWQDACLRQNVIKVCEMLSKYVRRLTWGTENDIIKTRNHLRQRGNILCAVFGIDVSKVSSEVTNMLSGSNMLEVYNQVRVNRGSAQGMDKTKNIQTSASPTSNLMDESVSLASQ